MPESTSFKAPTANLPAYFNQLSVTYPKSTGRSTEKLFAQLLPHIGPIAQHSEIHDNASGPATATSVLLATPDVSNAHPKIVCTDMVPAMIEAVQQLAKDKHWQNVEGIVMKSDGPMDFPDHRFTHSITNFSIFNFTDRVKAMSEVYRTLRPGGSAFVSTWKAFTPGEIIQEVQRRIRSDSPLMKMSGPEMYSDSAVTDVMVKGGFERENLRVVEGLFVAEDEDLQGLVEFIKSNFTSSARDGWTDEEKGRWNEVTDQVIGEHVRKDGGIKCEMWAIIGSK